MDYLKNMTMETIIRTEIELIGFVDYGKIGDIIPLLSIIAIQQDLRLCDAKELEKAKRIMKISILCN